MAQSPLNSDPQPPAPHFQWNPKKSLGPPQPPSCLGKTSALPHPRKKKIGSPSSEKSDRKNSAHPNFNVGPAMHIRILKHIDFRMRMHRIPYDFRAVFSRILMSDQLWANNKNSASALPPLRAPLPARPRLNLSCVRPFPYPDEILNDPTV